MPESLTHSPEMVDPNSAPLTVPSEIAAQPAPSEAIFKPETQRPYTQPGVSIEILTRSIIGTREYNDNENQYNRLNRYGISYNTLIGRETMTDWHEGERQAAQDSMAALAREVLAPIFKNKDHISTYEEALDSMVKIESSTVTDANGKEFPMRAYLKAKGTNIHYQNARAQRLREALGNPQLEARISEFTGGDWLHFGADRPIDPRLSERIRIYFNPGTALAGRVAAEVVRDFRQEFGYVPKGKIWDAASASHPSRRNDAGLFWAHSPEELTFIVSKLDAVTKEHAEWFGIEQEKPSVLLGEKIPIPTVSIAQEPSREMKDRDMDVSFNSSREAMIGKALDETLNKRYRVDQKIPRAELPELGEEFGRVLQLRAVEMGANGQSFAFNADQDLDVVAEAVSKGLQLAA